MSTHLSKYCVLSIQVAKVLPQGDEELRRVTAAAIVHHGDGAQLLVFDSRGYLGLEHSVVIALQSPPYALSSFPRAAGVTTLSQEVSLNGVEEAKVVKLDLA